MTHKKSTGACVFAFFVLLGAHAEILTWRAHAGQQYETRLTQKETVTGLDSITAKPTLITTNAVYQEEAAVNKSTIPYLRNLPAFPRSSIEPGATWTATASVSYDLSAFGLDEPYSVEVPVTYTCLDMTVIDSRSYYHITASWYPFKVIDKKTAKRSGIARISGVSTIDLLWDNKSGSPKKYALAEQIQYRFTDDTSLLVARETSEDFKTVTDIVRERTLKKLNEEIAVAKVANVEVKQTDAGIVLSIENIQFDPDSAVLVDAEKKKLTSVGAVLATLSGRKLAVIGHAANTGNDDPAGLLTLSAARAQSVADFLVATGIKKQDEIVASGMGDTKPLVPNDTPDGRTKNRRVEIVIMDEEASE